MRVVIEGHCATPLAHLVSDALLAGLAPLALTEMARRGTGGEAVAVGAPGVGAGGSLRTAMADSASSPPGPNEARSRRRRSSKLLSGVERGAAADAGMASDGSSSRLGSESTELTVAKS